MITALIFLSIGVIIGFLTASILASGKHYDSIIESHHQQLENQNKGD